MKESERFDITNPQWDQLLEGAEKESAGNVNINGVWAYADHDCDFAALEKAFWQVVEDNDALRLRIYKDGSKYLQTIQEMEPFALPRITVDGRQGFDAALREFEDVSFSMFREYLFEARIADCGGGAGGIMIRVHHMSCDGYSLGMIIRELDDNYQKIVSGEKPGKDKVFSFRLSCDADKAYMDGPEYTRDAGWWKELYRGIKKISFPTGRTCRSTDSDTVKHPLGAELSEKLAKYCSEAKVSQQTAVMALLGAYAAGVTGRDSFFLYTLLHNRTNIKLKRTMGNMVSCAPVFFTLNGELSANDFLQYYYVENMKVVTHGRFPMQKHIPLYLPLVFKTFFNYNFAWIYFSMMDHAAISAKTKLETGVAERHSLSVDLYLCLLNVPGEGLTLQLEYRTKKFTEEKAQRYLDDFAALIERTLEDPNQTMSALLKGVKK